jgi:hypothetical protein
MSELFQLSSKYPAMVPWSGSGGLNPNKLWMESCIDSLLDAQEQLAGFEPKAFFHMCGEHSSPHPVFPGA